MSFDNLFVVRTGLPSEYLCLSCKHLVYPDDAVRAPCRHLICKCCLSLVKECPDHPDMPFTAVDCQPIRGDPVYKKICKVFVHCVNRKDGCKWTGTLSEYTSTNHKKNCQWRVPGSQHKDQNARNIVFTTKEMAEKYCNAYFLWSYQGEMIDGEPILSDIKDQPKSMCAFFATASVFEATLRLKGQRVKFLCWKQLHKDYIEARSKQNIKQGSKLRIIGNILKEKGMVQLSADGEPLKPEIKWKADFKMFDMKSEQGVSQAVDHIHQHGPIICVYRVTSYQFRNKKSAGILHGEIRKQFSDGFAEEDATKSESDAGFATHAVCTIGLGVEDMTSFFPYQNSKGVNVQKDGFGRILPSSILQAVGLLFDESPERPSKRAKA